MDIDTTILTRVGTLTLQIMLTIIPLVLCTAHLRSARSYFLQRQIGVLHIRPGTKYFLTMGSIESVLLCVLSIPRLIAAGIFHFPFSSATSDILSVLSTLIIHAHIFRSMFLGHQYSHFLNGRPRCGRRWRLVFVAFMGLSVIICSACKFFDSALERALSGHHNPCAMGVSRWWNAAVLACGGVATIVCAFKIRNNLKTRRQLLPQNFRRFLAVLVSGIVKLLCAAFTWKSDMYPLSNRRDIVFAETIHLRFEFLPLVVSHLVLTESLVYSWLLPPQTDVRLGKSPKLVLLKEWMQTQTQTSDTERCKMNRCDHSDRFSLSKFALAGSRRHSGGEKSAHMFPHLYPHTRCDREESRSRDDCDRNSLAFARTIRGEFSGCGVVPLVVNSDAVRNVSGSYVPKLDNLALHDSAFGDHIPGGDSRYESKQNVFDEPNHEMLNVSISELPPRIQLLFKNDVGEHCLDVRRSRTQTPTSGTTEVDDPSRCRDPSGACACEFHQRALDDKLLPSSLRSEQDPDFGVNFAVCDRRWVEIGKRKPKR